MRSYREGVSKPKHESYLQDSDTGLNEFLFQQAVVILFMIALLIFICFTSSAQQPGNNIPTQTVRGTVTDGVLGVPLEGVSITLSNLDRSVTSDVNGIFRFPNVPVGNYTLTVSNVGYKEAVLENISVNSGKETVLNISMENLVKVSEAVIIKTSNRKNKPLNDMSAVSARAFSVEETQKYAAAVNDPLRMATGFPGVMAPDDGNNNIIIRGNSPTGMLWRMEGVDIPNPNHFSSTGSSGGGISILSAQLLSNSDFITGAFASEYGNALSGVFDLRLRKGNNEKGEYSFQAGLLGLNASAEGPFSKKYKGSYLVNYRYSTLQLLNKIGVPLEGGATNFQDLAYHVFLPTNKLGTFTLFGFAGLSDQNEKAEMDSMKWNGNDERYNSQYISNTAASGITHSTFIGNKTAIKTALAYSYNKIGENYQFLQDDLSFRDDYRDNYKTRKWTLSTTLNHKFSLRSTLRTGAILNRIVFDYYKRGREHEDAPLEEWINSRGKTQTVQAFAQWQYKLTNAVTISGGIHYLRLLYNHSQAAEPRASIKWQVSKSNSLAFGFGQHSQVQALGVYFAQQFSGGIGHFPNRDLDLTKARHYVISWQHSFSKNLSLRAEAYYQQLYQVPVSIYDSSTFSVLNIQSEYVTDPLVNDGKGRNYGVELSLERYLGNRFYYTVSTSLYESKYTAKDGRERDTRFNGNYIMNLVAGKEFLSSNALRTFGINIKTIYAGGLRTTPIDTQRSIQEGHTIWMQDQAFSLKNPDYFRTDLRLSLKWNRKRVTSTLSLDIQNVTNRLNVYGQWFDANKNEVVTTYQNGLIPVLNYKIEF